MVKKIQKKLENLLNKIELRKGTIIRLDKLLAAENTNNKEDFLLDLESVLELTETPDDNFTYLIDSSVEITNEFVFDVVTPVPYDIRVQAYTNIKGEINCIIVIND